MVVHDPEPRYEGFQESEVSITICASKMQDDQSVVSYFGCGRTRLEPG